MNRNKGITLIALVITIIVLLILAGVTLNIIMGDSGIINKAQIAKEKTNDAQYEEEQQINKLEDEINKKTDTINRNGNSGADGWTLLASTQGSETLNIDNINKYKSLVMMFDFDFGTYYTSIMFPAKFKTLNSSENKNWAISVHNISDICYAQYISDTSVKLTAVISGTVSLYGVN